MIAGSPFAKNEGKAVVRLLHQWDSKHRIKFGPPLVDQYERGSCSTDPGSEGIVVVEMYRGNLAVTIPTLVHEATHALWPNKKYRSKERALCDGAEDEYRAEVNEVTIYLWLRDVKNYPIDSELELRAKRLDEGHLKAVVFNRVTQNNESACSQ